MLISFPSHNEIAKIINLQRERVSFGSEFEILVHDPWITCFGPLVGVYVALARNMDWNHLLDRQVINRKKIH